MKQETETQELCFKHAVIHILHYWRSMAVLGVALTNVQKSYGFVESVVNGIGTSAGFLIAIVLLAGIREKIEYNDIPHSFKGSPIVLITAGLMSIAFFGFSGLI